MCGHLHHAWHEHGRLHNTFMSAVTAALVPAPTWLSINADVWISEWWLHQQADVARRTYACTHTKLHSIPYALPPTPHPPPTPAPAHTWLPVYADVQIGQWIVLVAGGAVSDVARRTTLWTGGGGHRTKWKGGGGLEIRGQKQWYACTPGDCAHCSGCCQ